MKKNKTVDARALPWDSEEQPALSYSGHRQDAAWIPVVSTSVPFPLEIFHQVCEALVLHPEWSRWVFCHLQFDTELGSCMRLIEDSVCDGLHRRQLR